VSPGARLILRRTVTAVLLAYVGAIVVVLVVQEVRDSRAEAGGQGIALTEPGKGPASQVVAVYFHRTARCISCRTIEGIARKTVETDFAGAVTDGKLAWRLINLDKPGNGHYAKDYSLVAQSMVLVEVKDGKPGRWKNLEKVWDLLDNEASLAQYLRTEIDAFLKGR
jgi:hypothetical protein